MAKSNQPLKRTGTQRGMKQLNQLAMEQLQGVVGACACGDSVCPCYAQPTQPSNPF